MLYKLSWSQTYEIYNAKFGESNGQKIQKKFQMSIETGLW